MAKKVAYVVTDKSIVKLVRKIQKHVLADPNSFDMDVLMERPEAIYPEMGVIPKKLMPHCGAVGCNAGWAATFSAGVTSKKALSGFAISFWSEGRAALNLRTFGYCSLDERDNRASSKSSEQLAELKTSRPGLPLATDREVFYVDYWPEPFQTKFQNEIEKTNPSRKKLAKINVARLEYFLKTGL